MGAGRRGPGAEHARPLVVIDPENRGQMKRLADAFVRHGDLTTDGMITLFREMAQPRPIEPQGLGAVVEDDEGRLFIRIEPDGGPAKWLLVQAPAFSDPRFVWSAIPAARVLSEGVSS